jgi:FG-GAP repeat
VKTLATLFLALGALTPLVAQFPLRWEADGTATSSIYGRSLALLDDFDGDGHDDLLIGAPGIAGVGGVIELRSSRSGAILNQYFAPTSFLNGGSTAPWGEIVMPFADLDGDGLRDFIVRNLSSGAGGVISSGSGLEIPHPFFGPGYIQIDVIELDDMNGDGLSEWAANYPVTPNFSFWVTSVHDGATFAPLGSATSTLRLDQLAAISDRDGDGFRDIAISKKPTSFFPFDPNVYDLEVLSSATLSPLQTLFAASISQNFLIADLNGDGVDDIAGTTSAATLLGPASIEAYDGANLPLQLYFWSNALSPTSDISPRLTAADVDADGLAELIFATDGGLFALEDDGSFAGNTVMAGRLGNLAFTSLRPRHLIALGDVSGDGFEEVGFSANSTNNSQFGELEVLSAHGAFNYGLASGSTSDLSLAWLPNSTLASGQLLAEFGAPSGPGFLLLSFAGGFQTVFGLDIYLNSSPLAGFVIEPISFDALGRWQFPLSLAQPGLANLSLYLQAIDAAPLPQARASNGLELRFR